MTFFQTFLANWNGKEKRELVIETLAFVPYAEFESMCNASSGFHC